MHPFLQACAPLVGCQRWEQTGKTAKKNREMEREKRKNNSLRVTRCRATQQVRWLPDAVRNPGSLVVSMGPHPAQTQVLERQCPVRARRGTRCWRPGGDGAGRRLGERTPAHPAPGPPGRPRSGPRPECHLPALGAHVVGVFGT